MNIDKERKLFLYELNGHGYNFVSSEWDSRNNSFVDECLNMVWEMWIASRNREGYVLVPKHELKIILDCITPDDMNLNEGVYEASEVIEKAIMGGCNE